MVSGMIWWRDQSAAPVCTALSAIDLVSGRSAVRIRSPAPGQRVYRAIRSPRREPNGEQGLTLPVITDSTARHRGHGEDAIYFDATKNRYVGAVSLGFGPDGKRSRRKVTGRTKQEAREKLKALPGRSLVVSQFCWPSCAILKSQKSWPVSLVLPGRGHRPGPLV